MRELWILGDSNSLTIGAMLQRYATPPAGWVWRNHAVGAMPSDAGLLHAVERLRAVPSGSTVEAVYICFGGADGLHYLGTQHPEYEWLHGPPDPIGLTRSRTPEAAGMVQLVLADHLRRQGVRRVVLARGVGTLTVPHPQVAPPTLYETRPEWLPFMAEFADCYRRTAYVFRGWPQQLNYHASPSDPQLWMPDHFHVSERGAMIGACAIWHDLMDPGGLWAA